MNFNSAFRFLSAFILSSLILSPAHAEIKGDLITDEKLRESVAQSMLEKIQSCGPSQAAYNIYALFQNENSALIRRSLMATLSRSVEASEKEPTIVNLANDAFVLTAIKQLPISSKTDQAELIEMKKAAIRAEEEDLRIADLRRGGAVEVVIKPLENARTQAITELRKKYAKILLADEILKELRLNTSQDEMKLRLEALLEKSTCELNAETRPVWPIYQHYGHGGMLNQHGPYGSPYNNVNYTQYPGGFELPYWETDASGVEEKNDPQNVGTLQQTGRSTDIPSTDSHKTKLRN
jgi:hypothetical protein